MFPPFNQLNNKQQDKVREDIMTTLYSGPDHDSAPIQVLYYFDPDESGSDYSDAVYGVKDLEYVIEYILYVISNYGVATAINSYPTGEDYFI
jgi:hypothetical protein